MSNMNLYLGGFSPLTGITQLETLFLIDLILKILHVSVPLRGLLSQKPKNMIDRYKKESCFSPLTGITQLETFNRFSSKLLFGQFQSPYGDYLVRNIIKYEFFLIIPKVSVPLRGLLSQKLAQPLISFITDIKRFQSPYGDYLVRNNNEININLNALNCVSVPLRGLLSQKPAPSET